MAANDEHETAAHISRLTSEINNLQAESNELTGADWKLFYRFDFSN